MPSFVKSKIFLGVVTLIILLGVGSILRIWWYVGNNQGYAPDQPIPFSHARHAGENKIPCMYCHSNADNGRHATIPSMNVCMNCHLVVKTDSPHIQKLTKLYQENKPIEWIRIHDLPDHAFFNHKKHIEKGFECSVCHGDVANMKKIEQVKTLQMGFCINCHRENGGSDNCSTCHQ